MALHISPYNVVLLGSGLCRPIVHSVRKGADVVLLNVTECAIGLYATGVFKLTTRAQYGKSVASQVSIPA